MSGPLKFKRDGYTFKVWPALHAGERFARVVLIKADDGDTEEGVCEAASLSRFLRAESITERDAALDALRVTAFEIAAGNDEGDGRECA